MKTFERFTFFFVLFSCFFAFVGCGGGGGGGTIFDTATGDGTAQSLEAERPAVNARVNALVEAMAAKDVEKTVGLCSPEMQDHYRSMFEAAPEQMVLLADALKKATLTSVAPGKDVSGAGIGMITVEYASCTFELTVVKRNGEWAFQNL